MRLSSKPISKGTPEEFPIDDRIIGYAPRDIKEGEILLMSLSHPHFFITSDGLRSLTAEEAAALREKANA